MPGAAACGLVDAPILALNLVAGVLAFFSPCGFPMLPAYLAYYLPRGEPAGARALARGLGGGALAALGALSVLIAIGALAVALGEPFRERVLLLELVGGLVVLGLGVLTLLGRAPSFRVGIQPAQARGAAGLVAFGALYAAVGAGCVAPVFLAILFDAFSAPGAAEGALRVGVYAFGFAATLVVVTVLVATTQGAALAFLRRALRHVERASGIVLVAVGSYLVWYWAHVEGYA